MELLDEFGVHGADRMVFLAMQEKLSFRLASEAIGLTEGRVRHRFFAACELLQVDPRGRQFVEALLNQIYAVARPTPSSPEN
jgi:hypothetical protein